MNHTGCVLLCVVLAGGARAGTGDANLDGRVDMADAAATLRFVAGFEAPTAFQAAAADASPPVPDRRLTLLDAVAQARIATGLQTAPPSWPLITRRAINVVGGVLNLATDAGYRVTGQVLPRTGGPMPTALTFEQDFGPLDWGPPPSQVPYRATCAVAADGSFAVTLRPLPYLITEEYDSSETTAAGGTTLTRRPNLALPYLYPGLRTTITTEGQALDYQAYEPAFLYDVPWQITTDPKVAWTARRIDMYTPVAGVGEQAGVHRTMAPDSGRLRAASGQYEMRIDGDITLSDGSVEPWTLWAQNVIVPNTGPAFYLSRMVEVSGKVTARPGATPTTVQLYPTRSAYPSGYTVDFDHLLTTVPIAADGSYRLAAWPERYWVVVSANTPDGVYQAGYGFPTLTANTTFNLGMAPMREMKDVTGTVIGPDGRGVAGAAVSFSQNPNLWAYRASTVSDAAGAYHVRIPQGWYAVTVEPAP